MTLCKFTPLPQEERAVSAVIGVVIMIAVTVVLAGVIWSFVLGAGEDLNQTTPEADISFSYNATTNEVVITHGGGELLSDSNTGVLTVQKEAETEGDWGGKFDEVSSEDTITEATITEQIETGDLIWESESEDTGLQSGDEITVTWESPDGSNSNVIGSFTAP